MVDFPNNFFTYNATVPGRSDIEKYLAAEKDKIIYCDISLYGIEAVDAFFEPAEKLRVLYFPDTKSGIELYIVYSKYPHILENLYQQINPDTSQLLLFLEDNAGDRSSRRGFYHSGKRVFSLFKEQYGNSSKEKLTDTLVDTITLPSQSSEDELPNENNVFTLSTFTVNSGLNYDFFKKLYDEMVRSYSGEIMFTYEDRSVLTRGLYLFREVATFTLRRVNLVATYVNFLDNKSQDAVESALDTVIEKINSVKFGPEAWNPFNPNYGKDDTLVSATLIPLFRMLDKEFNYLIDSMENNLQEAPVRKLFKGLTDSLKSTLLDGIRPIQSIRFIKNIIDKITTQIDDAASFILEKIKQFFNGAIIEVGFMVCNFIYGLWNSLVDIVSGLVFIVKLSWLGMCALERWTYSQFVYYYQNTLEIFDSAFSLIATIDLNAVTDALYEEVKKSAAFLLNPLVKAYMSGYIVGLVIEVAIEIFVTHGTMTAGTFARLLAKELKDIALLPVKLVKAPYKIARYGIKGLIQSVKKLLLLLDTGELVKLFRSIGKSLQYEVKVLKTDLQALIDFAADLLKKIKADKQISVELAASDGILAVLIDPRYLGRERNGLFRFRLTIDDLNDLRRRIEQARKDLGPKPDNIEKAFKDFFSKRIDDAEIRKVEQTGKNVDDVGKAGDDIKNKTQEYSRNATHEDIEKLASIRKKYKPRANRNVAFAKGEIGGVKIELETVSGGKSTTPWQQKGNFESPKPENYYFKDGPEGFKINHTEQNVFEYLYLMFKHNKNISGEIELISDLRYCDNCYWISEQFQKEFKNIKVIKVFVREKLK